MKNTEKFLVEFERYLKNNIWEFEKHKTDELYIYDIDKRVVILVEAKSVYSKEHIIVKELLNFKNYNSYNYDDIKIKPFCKNYISGWISFISFDGEITDELIRVDKKIPSLKLIERYNDWRGNKVWIAGFQLVEDNEIGYAVTIVKEIEGIKELRKISKKLLQVYTDYIINNKFDLKEKIIKIEDSKGCKFFIDSTMANILNKRYLKKITAYHARNIKVISDLKGFWGKAYLKNEKDVPYNLFEDLKVSKFDDIGVIQDIYTENMKKNIVPIEELIKEYFVVSVVFIDQLDYFDEYSYLSSDTTIVKGDKVLVNVGGKEDVAFVVNAQKCFGWQIYFNIKKIKTIIKKIDSEEELNKYGYSLEDFDIF